MRENERKTHRHIRLQSESKVHKIRDFPRSHKRNHDSCDISEFIFILRPLRFAETELKRY